MTNFDYHITAGIGSGSGSISSWLFFFVAAGSQCDGGCCKEAKACEFIHLVFPLILVM
ncbi:hypothetical protein [Vogesella alkaliphila]|uniref:hypothetical protein n=1 Tax=Vogesella alkaliphila TaxID=1193621 RepID=UPI001E5CE087|nr:hypothetical protein [Vogesella alkaliphila]